MDPTATLPLRCLRAALLAVVVVTVGSVAHVSAGGSMPGAASLLSLCAALAVACAGVLGRQASTARLVALTVGGQLVVHGALSALAGHVAAPAMAHGPHGGMVHPGSGPAASSSLASSVVSVLGHGVADAFERPLMTAAHVAAAAVVGVWLAVGERALWTFVRLARCTARGVLTAALAALGLHPVVLRSVRRSTGVRAVGVDPLPLLPVWSRGPARRGPPPVLLPH